MEEMEEKKAKQKAESSSFFALVFLFFCFGALFMDAFKAKYLYVLRI